MARLDSLPLAFLFVFAGATLAQPIQLSVDASDAPRRIFHARMTMQVKPGPLTLAYPKWIRGEHGPNGPINDLMGLVLTAAGTRIPWQRDPVDVFAFHCDIPAGVSALEIALDSVSSPLQDGFSGSSSTTAELAVLNWHLVLLYPKGTPSDDLTYAATLRLPAGWKFATALRASGTSGETISFEPVSLTRLVDSPLIAGAHFRSIPIAPDVKPPHHINIVADSDAALEMPFDMIGRYSQLVKETGELFGGIRHYGHYDFLLTLSDQTGHFGLEHSESSDDRAAERALTDETLRKVGAMLLSHEFVHSWNGKYRRPADLTAPAFDQPQKTSLLWVYEGLTEYLGYVLAARSGLLTAENARSFLAAVAAEMDHRPGREWRSLLDTAVAAPVLYNARDDWSPWRRSVDFYPEGLLIWLETDVTIRNQTGGKRSLDDFCRSFFAGPSGSPGLSTYSFDDVVAALHAVVPFDWRGFFEARLNATTSHAPLGGIAGAGWRVVYKEEPSDWSLASELAAKRVDLRYSLGLQIAEDGAVVLAIDAMPAAQAGVAATMKLVAVNGRQWSAQLLHEALRAKAPIELLLRNGEFYQTYRIDYRGGDQYPYLDRTIDQPDLLAEILKPRSK
jgi:predicted metalloprotease with PDZ domain